MQGKTKEAISLVQLVAFGNAQRLGQPKGEPQAEKQTGQQQQPRSRPAVKTAPLGQSNRLNLGDISHVAPAPALFELRIPGGI